MTDRNSKRQFEGRDAQTGRFLTGNIGGGRPKGSRNKLGEAFLGDLYADWVENGVAVIQKVRETCPDVYLKVVASILPKQLEIERDPFDGVTDDELAALIAAARDALGIAEKFEGEKDETAH
jgi:hypothetical protein